MMLAIVYSSFCLATENVLVIHSYDSDHYWTKQLTIGINEELGQQSDVRVFHEYLDAKRFATFNHKNQFISYVNDKFKGSPLSAVLVTDDAALLLVREYRSSFFPTVPVVYSGINKVEQTLIDSQGYTGVFENRDIGNSVLDIKQITGSDGIIIVTDTTAPGQMNLAKIQSIQKHPDAPNQLIIIEDLGQDEIQTKLGQYPNSFPIFKIGQLVNKQNGSLLGWPEGASQIVNASINPLFTIATQTLDHGVVGVDHLDAKWHGKQAASIVNQIISGVSVDDIPAITEAELRWTFDWQQTKRFGFSKDSFPADYVLINQDESFYQKHKVMVWVVVFILLTSISIIGLLIEVIRRGRQSRQILEENERRYKDLAGAGANVFWELNNSREFIYLSGDTQSLFGIKLENMKGQSLEKVIANAPNIDFPWEQINKNMSDHQPLSHLLFTIRTSSKRLKVLMLNGSAMFDDDNNYLGYRGICNDVTQEHELSEQLAFQASFDTLTGLRNRRSFNEYLRRQLREKTVSPKEAEAQKPCEQLDAEISSYLCFLDLDRFKLVNDTAGHLVGDAMLEEVAKRICELTSDNDVLGRLGGDEFGLIFVNQSLKTATRKCQAIIDAIIAYRYIWNHKKLQVGISIGMVKLNTELTETELLSKANLSCQKAKSNGGAKLYVASPDHKDLYEEELQIGYIANVANAIENNQFYLVKQAIARTEDTNNHHHYEILLRFKDESGTLVSPALFIPAAEKHGVICLIDDWVVSTVLDNYHLYFRDKEPVVSINLSGLSLSNDEFIQRLTEKVKNSKVNPSNICFEITETAVMSNLSPALNFIKTMKSIGIKFALDDFGSGASSYGYLKQLPVDYLKIDGSLIQHICTEPTDRAMVKSIHEIACMMGMKTIAEFVENEGIIKVLDDIGVDYVQGYGIGKPEPCVTLSDY